MENYNIDVKAEMNNTIKTLEKANREYVKRFRSKKKINETAGSIIKIKEIKKGV